MHTTTIAVSAFIAASLLAFAGCEPIDANRPGSDPAMRTTDSPPVTPSPVMPAPMTPAPVSPAPLDKNAPSPADTPSSTTPTTPPGNASTDRPAPDNTAVNKRDASGETKTAIDQKETQRDVSITADIRKKVIAAENMSINARNVKIITEDGKVVLRGPVNSAEEKEQIDKMAREVAGKDNVDNQIEVSEK